MTEGYEWKCVECEVEFNDDDVIVCGTCDDPFCTRGCLNRHLASPDNECNG